MSAPLLSVVGVVKRFGRLTAVDGVSFDVSAGDVLGIAGPNGAGKTTLFNLLTGIPFGPDAGSIYFEGQRIDRMAAYRIAHRGMVRTFQTEAVFESLTVEENCRLAAAYGRPARRVGNTDEQAKEALSAVGLFEQRNRSSRELSLIDKKRLMIASGLACRPKLLLLDEPIAGLNGRDQDAMGDLIASINSTGITIVLIEHVLALLMRLSSRVMIMNEGRTLALGAPSEVVRDERVVRAYLGDKGTRDLRIGAA